MQAEQQLAALQQRAVRSAEKQWQLPDGFGTAAAAAEHIDGFITGGQLEVITYASVSMSCHCLTDICGRCAANINLSLQHLQNQSFVA